MPFERTYKKEQVLLFSLTCFLVMLFSCTSAIAQTELPIPDKQYQEQIKKHWNQNRARYAEMMKQSGEVPYNLYSIQEETNNLLKYAGYCQEYALLDELCSLYLQSVDTLTTTDQYVFYCYPDSPILSVHPLDKKYRMWVDKQKPNGEESILVSSQFLYVLSDAVVIIADINKENRTPIMKDALNTFIPLLVEHYSRWIFNTPGPFQVRGWGCRYDGGYVPTGMNHLEFLNKKLDRKLGNGESPSYCNAVDDTDMWIIAGVTNILTVYQKEQALVSISPEQYNMFHGYVRTGIELLESRFSYTELKDFNGNPVVGALFDAGAWDDHADFEYVGYTGHEFPKISPEDTSEHHGKGVGWDLSHARRFVHVFASLLAAKDVLGLDFPTIDLMGKMSNQLAYGTFNRDFQKPLFTNFMDGTNGWYRVGYSGRPGFGYGPWDMSLYVFVGGYGFWSIYNDDITRVFIGFINMMDSKDPAIRKHIIEHYATTYWDQYKRSRIFGYEDEEHCLTQSLFLQVLPTLCLMPRKYN